MRGNREEQALMKQWRGGSAAQRQRRPNSCWWGVWEGRRKLWGVWIGEDREKARQRRKQEDRRKLPV
jgi:hypothetical protein